MSESGPQIPGDARARHLAWAMDLTGIPTAAGREQGVVAWVERWAGERPDVALTRDRAGNLHVAFRGAPTVAGPAVYFTAHMDHPAFVVERVVAPSLLELSFRGGVMEEYFAEARVVLHGRGGQRLPGRLTGQASAPAGVFKFYSCELDRSDVAGALVAGDIGTWDVGATEVIEGILHTLACDDLAALGAALAAFDVLRAGPRHDVRLLLTRAEEIGFVGAIAACRQGTMEKGARVIALENSRSFAESPIGGGPIVRVGDRLSVFSPTLTDAVARRAEDIAGAPATVTATQKLSQAPAWKWQRKLMAGGACEASVFYHAGYECTCVCLPLGNYHNMADLDAVQAGTNTTAPRVGREFIAVADYHGLVDLLVACGRSLPAASSLSARFEKLWNERRFVLE